MSTQSTSKLGDDLHDIELPASDQPVLTMSGLAGPKLTPRQIIRFYSPDEWEIFIREWVTALKKDYWQIKRHSGAGDRGLDVIGLVTAQGLRGEWDCYQCKHYAEPLFPGDAFAEMAKIMLGVAEDAFTYPRSYFFVAPMGAGMSLERMISDPKELKDKFLEKLSDIKSPINSWKSDRIAKVLKIAKDADYSIFESAQLDDIVDEHRGTPYFNARFGGVLNERPPTAPIPTGLQTAETGYIEQLLKVYKEKSGNPEMTLESVKLAVWYREHLNRQRTSFFSAESLRTFARDNVPAGTYDSLKDEVYEGVVEVEQDDSHVDGISRLNKVLSAASAMKVDENALIIVWRQLDRKGICHQLANENRLTWCQEGTQ
ncbi:ABC-three component system protein [Rhodococcus erythropolis]|uniref:ABC-three component system protein n=1 Tax=Rhodococcus erythropolis TaxID=1833 RepID=UPI001F226CFB|nr:ABC-three component system protein [Rhodococcus erythropolis]